MENYSSLGNKAVTTPCTKSYMGKFNKDLRNDRNCKVFQLLLIHDVKTKKISVVKDVWMADVN